MGKTSWPYLGVILVWFIFSSQYFLKGFVPFPSTYLVSFFPPWNAYYGMPVKNNAMPDIVTQIYPWKKATIENWKKGKIPLWNPHSFSGTVHGGNYQSAIFSPINFLFAVFPFIHAWSLHVLLQPLASGLFMILFLTSLKRSNVAVLLGSLSFMFCGFMTTWMGYGTLGWAVAFLPLTLAGVAKYNETKSWWSGILISISIATSLLSGHYQISLYLLLATATFIIGYSKEKVKPVLFVLLGIFLCSDQILLTLHSFLQSNRGESFTSGSIPWSYFITLFSPDFYGNPVTRNDWFGQYAEWSSYVGVVPLVFAVYSLFSSWGKEKRIFFSLATISLLISMTSPINFLLYAVKIPIISTSVATRMIVLFSFSLTVLASFGLDELIEDWKKKTSNVIKKISIISMVFLVLFWMRIFFFNILPTEYIEIAKRNSILPSGLLLIVVSGVVLGLQTKKIQKSLLILFVFATTFEMLRFSQKWMPFDPQEYVYPDLPVITYLQKYVGYQRVFGTFGNELVSYYGFPSIEGYDAMYQKRYGEFISAAGDGNIQELQRSVVQIDKQGKYTNKWLELLGVKYLLYRKSDGRNVWTFPHWEYPQYTSVYQDDKYEILENSNALPRALLVSSYRVIPDKQSMLTALVSEETNLRTTVFLEDKPNIEPTSGRGSADIVTYNSNSVDIDVTAERPSILVLSDTYDPGWQVFVNGKEEKLHRANYAFRAVSVPSGVSHVVFYYRPRFFILGLWISGISTFVLLAGCMRKLLYDRWHL